jgi:DNA-directed RNA polymerase subunit RPC12/RpoP
MSIIKLNCQSCGGQIELDHDKDSGFCRHCGNKVLIKPDTVINKYDNATQNIVNHYYAGPEKTNPTASSSLDAKTVFWVISVFVILGTFIWGTVMVFQVISWGWLGHLYHIICAYTILCICLVSTIFCARKQNYKLGIIISCICLVLVGASVGIIEGMYHYGEDYLI